MRLIRLAEGETNSTRWAKRMGWTLPQLSNYENGVMISRDAAIKMAEQVSGLTTDYIFRGKTDGMTIDLRRRLEEAEALEAGDESPKAEENRKSTGGER
jgi:transcriptional regulator with XRE-family HTH domain